MNSAGAQSSAPAEGQLPATLGSGLVHPEGARSFANSKARSSEMYWQLRSFGANSLIIALLSPFLALTMDFVPKVLLAIVVLDIPIQFGTYLFYRPADAALGALKGLSISATTLAVAGLYLSWSLRAMASRIRQQRSSLHINIPLLAYLLIAALSVFVARDPTLALFDVWLLVEACLIYFYVANNIRTREDVLFVVKLLMIGCLFESMVIIIMRFTVNASTSWAFPIHIIAENLGTKGMRIGGTIGVPNVAGAYLSIMIASAVSLLFTNLGRPYKWMAAAVLELGGIALILTFSRGGWIALAVATVVLCFSTWRQRGLSLKAPVTILATLVLLYLPLHGLISARIFGDDKGSAESRIPLDKLALRMIADNPMLGVGANNFTVAMDRYVTSEFRHAWLWAVHNRYLLILAETGIGGLLAYLAFLFGTLRRGWRCWKFQDPLLSPIALGFVAGIAGNMVHQSVDLFRDRPIQQLLWLVAGLLAALHRICKEDQESRIVSRLV
jgi:putative inorganic carbon (HCO3(-)) transporter